MTLTDFITGKKAECLDQELLDNDKYYFCGVVISHYTTELVLVSLITLFIQVKHGITVLQLGSAHVLLLYIICALKLKFKANNYSTIAFIQILDYIITDKRFSIYVLMTESL